MSVKVRKYSWKKKDGTVSEGWQVDVICELPSGEKYRERRKSPHPSKAGSQRWGDERLAFLLQNGGPEQPAARPPTLEEFAEVYLDAARGNRQKASTIYAKKTILDAHLKPMFGKRRVDLIGLAEATELKAKLSKHKPKTVNNVLAVLSGLLNLAHDLKKRPDAPPPLGMLLVVQDEAPFYDFADYASLVDGAGKCGLEEELAVLLGGDAGLREGEILALERPDISFKTGLITIRRAVWYGPKTDPEDPTSRAVVDLPKGNKIRRVPMTDALRAALLRARHLKSKLVLCQENGGRLTPKRLATLMRRAQERAGLEATGNTHILRHTFCSHLAMRGATAKAIQELAGHVHLSTTMRYMHLSPAARDEAIALLNRRPAGASDRGTSVESER